MAGQTSQCLSSGDFHFTEKANGIKYLYAWLDKHPDIRAMSHSSGMFYLDTSVLI
jgi:hypothetical protein